MSEPKKCDCEVCKAESCILRKSGGTVYKCDFLHIGLKEGSTTYEDLLE